MKFILFFCFCGSFVPSCVRIQIQLTKIIRTRIHDPAFFASYKKYGLVFLCRCYVVSALTNNNLVTSRNKQQSRVNFYIYIFLCVIFALLRPDPDPADQKNLDPDPRHCFFLFFTRNLDSSSCAVVMWCPL